MALDTVHPFDVAIRLAGSGGGIRRSRYGPAKQAIIEVVKAATTQGSPKFVPPAERIATFDQDGTLWVEHPIYFRCGV
jgi:hypothetical protein